MKADGFRGREEHELVKTLQAKLGLYAEKAEEIARQVHPR